jgi:hypothetical protein
MVQQNLKDSAKAYVPKKTGNIADLETVNIETMQVEDREGVNDEGKAYAYKVIVFNGDEYRVPATVLSGIKNILTIKPNLKLIKVTKRGTGLNTEYQVIPLD